MAAKKKTASGVSTDPVQKSRKAQAALAAAAPIETAPASESAAVETAEVPVALVGGPPTVSSPSPEGGTPAEAETAGDQTTTRKPLSALEAAARVLAETGRAMSCPELIAAMAAKGYWTSPQGRTPHATLYASFLRELQNKGDDARFRKSERGKFMLKGTM